MYMWAEVSAHDVDVSTYAREKDMPGALAPLHVNEREADSQGLRRKEEERCFFPPKPACSQSPAKG